MMRTEQHDTHDHVRVISGSVNSDGTRKSGSGFTVTRSALGVYAVSWTFLVRQAITIVASAHTGIGFATVTTDWGPRGFQLVIWNFGVTSAIDADFGFIATVVPQ